MVWETNTRTLEKEEYPIKSATLGEGPAMLLKGYIHGNLLNRFGTPVGTPG